MTAVRDVSQRGGATLSLELSAPGIGQMVGKAAPFGT